MSKKSKKKSKSGDSGGVELNEASMAALAQQFANYAAGGSIADTRAFGRTGENRFTTPGAGSVVLPDGSRAALAIRYDDVSYETLDKARFYPVLRDCIDVVVSAVCRAGCHFVSENDMAKQLATVLVRPHVRSICQNLTNGALQFGCQTAEKVEKYFYNVKTTTTQSDGGAASYVFPFAVGFSKFLYFDPSDTILLLDSETGDFGGIKQYVPTKEGRVDIPASKLLHYVNDREFDSVYGFAQTKSAIPFVRLAEMFYDDMAKWSRAFGAPYKVGRFRPGFTPTGQVDSNGFPVKLDNRDVMLALLNAINSGASVAYASEFDPATNQPYWDIKLLEVSGDGAQHYVDMIKHCNDMIRTSFGIPAYATAESPDKGTFSLGKSMIDLFLRSINARLDGLKDIFDNQLLPRWNTLNFGEDAPPIVIEFEPPDLDPNLMLMTAMVQATSSGKPLIDGDGNQVTPDYPFLLQSAGIPFKTSKYVPPDQDTADQQDNSGDLSVSAAS